MTPRRTWAEPEEEGAGVEGAGVDVGAGVRAGAGAGVDAGAAKSERLATRAESPCVRVA